MSCILDPQHALYMHCIHTSVPHSQCAIIYHAQLHAEFNVSGPNFMTKYIHIPPHANSYCYRHYMACRALPVVTRPSGPSTIAVSPIGFAHPGWPHKKSNWVQYTSEPLGRHSGCNKLNVPSDLLTLTKACLQNRTYPPSPLVEPCSQHHTSNRLQSHSEAGDRPVFAVRCLQTSMKEQQAAAAAGAATTTTVTTAKATTTTTTATTTTTTTTTTTAATTAPQHLDALHHNRPIRWPEHGAVKCGR